MLIRKEKYINTFNTYAKEACMDDDGSQRQNLNHKQRDGLKSLRERVKQGDLIIMQTNKTGKFCV